MARSIRIFASNAVKAKAPEARVAAPATAKVRRNVFKLFSITVSSRHKQHACATRPSILAPQDQNVNDIFVIFSKELQYLSTPSATIEQMVSIALSLLCLGQPADLPLIKFLAAPQPSFPAPKVTKTGDTYDIEFTSQKWQNTLWNHRILFRVPKGAEKFKTALLYITGDGPKNGDYLDLNLLSAATGMPIAMLFNIPNQPIWGMKEDDLIAHTFNKYLETKDETWPLLFPMTKSAVSSLDVVQSIAKQNDLYIKNFVVTGASKRGWTTWLTAASQDKRIIGIAPMVFDNLKFNEQMKKQLADWGKYSDQIEDYTRRGLQQKLETPSGNDLLEMVDPYSYRKRINVPTLIVNGANDAYWTVDAHTRYWNDLKQPKWILELPNSGHGLEDRSRVVSTVGAFCRSLSGLFKMPTLSTKRKFDGPEPKHVIFEVKTTESEPLSLAIWKAESDSKDFRSSKWNEQRFEKGPVIQRDITEGKFNAMFVEARFSIEGRSFTISSPVEVLYGGKQTKEIERK